MNAFAVRNCAYAPSSQSMPPNHLPYLLPWEQGKSRRPGCWIDSCRLRTITNWFPFCISEEEEEDQGDEDRVDGIVRGPGPKGPSGTVSEAQLARRITKGKSSRRMLSNKPQDFQVGRALLFCAQTATPWPTTQPLL